MSDFFMGEMRLFPYNFSPRFWAYANGQTLPIAQNAALFSLLGTQYGGNGQTTFNLPDQRGRALIHWGSGPGRVSRVIGEAGGSESEILNISQIPQHVHALNATTANATTATPGPTVLPGAITGDTLYGAGTGELSPLGVSSSTGNSQAHSNMMPYLAISYSIALQGIYPSRN